MKHFRLLKFFFPGLIGLSMSLFALALVTTAALASTSEGGENSINPRIVQQVTPVAPTTLTSEQQPRYLQMFYRDPVGNSIAVIVLILMLVSLVVCLYLFLNSPASIASKGIGPGWIIPLLCILGLGVAGYLTYVEITHARAVCGPVGDCNSVQQSPYAKLWGILPVGVLGMLGYLAILIIWIIQRNIRLDSRSTITLLMWGMALFGVLFTVYLTFLEPFVIGATCAWCISSAILITLLLWATTGTAIQAGAAAENS
ncbi:MAG: vitamin K epoxide reductase family protein [Omnitrophica WOR_2 bacterium]